MTSIWGSRWSAEEDKLLKECLEEGLTFEEVHAALDLKFGLGRSRNSCIGRALRLKIKARSSEAHRAECNRAAYHGPKRKLTPRVELPPKPKRRAPSYGAPPIAPDSIPAGSTAFKVIRAIKARHKDVQIPKDLRPLRCDPVEPLKLDLVDLKDGDCRWPGGGWPGKDPVTFCGHPAALGSSYCAGHKQLSVGSGTAAEQSACRILTARAAA